jgi:hypothetical protein
MAKSKLSLVKEDARSFVVQHPNGHQITFAKHGVSEETLKMLRTLPKVQKFADGGEVQPLDIEPISADSGSSAPLEVERVPASEPAPEPTPQASAPTPTEDVISDSQAAPSDEPNPAPSDADSSVQDGNALSDAANAANASAQTQAAPSVSNDAAPPKSPTEQIASMPDDLMGQMKSNEKLEEQGIKEAAAAKTQSGKAQAAAYDENIKQLQASKQQFDQEHKAIASQMDTLYNQAVNGKIDPNRVWNNKSTGSKISTIVGILFSGIGAGITKQPNMAVQLLNDQINRDIDSQKADIQNKQTLYSLNLQRYRDTTAAEEATRMQLQAIVGGQVATAAARAQGPEAQAQAKIMLGQMRNGMIPQMQQLAMTRLLTSGNIASVNPNLLPDHLRDRFVPGVGLATTKEDAAKVKDMKPKFDTFLSTLSQLQTFAQKHAGTVMDRATVNEGKTLAAQAQDQYRQLNGEGVFRAGEASFIESMIPSDPTAYFAKSRTLPKLAEVQKVARQSATNFYRARGVNPPGVNFVPDSQK